MKLPWDQTEATVLQSRYQFARLNTLTLGIQTQKKFCVTYTFSVDGTDYTGTFQSPTAILQNERIPVRYNPADPAENNLSNQPPVPEISLVFIGIALLFLIPLLWLILHHGHR
ncbi:hypothetical protein SAMN05421771_2276 [Granulicella pectinivorans]|uniref:DUF3592 domain-containing protein n=1 Tax=Granulicella pectinivorans TaxID=474950 RepID=A0A1I6MCB3_9BACT|nr:hypothetical protein [Granulicella pectinivorans]SFS13335.1 hypothetical protein SAMN05421771_2276 [Granulicella pectinivorans]